MSMINADENFEKLGLTLPPAPAPAGVYKPCVIDGKYLYLSGHGPVRNDKSLCFKQYLIALKPKNGFSSFLSPR